MVCYTALENPAHQLTSQGALELGWPFRAFPSWAKMVEALYLTLISDWVWLPKNWYDLGQGGSFQPRQFWKGWRAEGWMQTALSVAGPGSTSLKGDLGSKLL